MIKRTYAYSGSIYVDKVLKKAFCGHVTIVSWWPYPVEAWEGALDEQDSKDDLVIIEAFNRI